MPRPDEAFEAASLRLFVPKVLPVARTLEIPVVIILMMKRFGHEGDLEIVCGILHLLGGRPVNAFDTEVVQMIPVCETAAAFLHLIFRFGLCVLEHGFIGFLPINAWKLLEICVSKNKLGITSALSPAVEVPAAAIGKPSFMPIDIH